MDLTIDTSSRNHVKNYAERIFKDLFPKSEFTFIGNAFSWIHDCFSGNFENYLRLDLKYHDYEHTLQVTTCMIDLFKGYHMAKAYPVLTDKIFEIGLLAILLHDTGYLKTDDDIEGTGAKYTITHVFRSCDVAKMLLSQKGYTAKEILAVQDMILCTGVNSDISKIPFQTALEKKVGYMLGTSDLVGQMAAENYIKKLPFLYLEFEESFHYSKTSTKVAELYKSADELMKNTPNFWEHYVKPKLNDDFQKIYEFLGDPSPNGENLYLRRIESNIAVLKTNLTIQNS